jgi:alanine racemase
MSIQQTMNLSTKRCWAEVNLEALRHNAGVLRQKLGDSAGIMAVVKANAYGHGVQAVVEELEPLVEAFGVANVTEALQIAQDVEPERIFILGTALPAEREVIAWSGFVPTVSSLEEARAYDRFAGGQCLAVNVVIDTGMGRIGILEKDALEEVRAIAELPGIEIKTVSTHLPVSDEDEAFTAEQLARFEKIIAELRGAGVRVPLVHVLNSAGAVQFSAHAHDLARIGLALYGSSPVATFQKNLRAVMTLKTRVTNVRKLPAGHGVSYGRTFVTQAPTSVATLATGYADGYPRRLSGAGAEVLLRGKRCPVLGRVTMDQIMADVSALPGVEPGDEAVLIGRQGAEEIFAADLARQAGTIAWEIFTGISSRVERICTHRAEPSAEPEND